MTFIVWIVFITLESRKVEAHKKACENKDFWNVVMTSKQSKRLINTKNLIEHLLSFIQILNLW